MKRIYFCLLVMAQLLLQGCWDGNNNAVGVVPLPDTTPAAFSFPAQTGVSVSVAVVSVPATITGIDAPASISVTGGEYSIDGAAFTAAPGTVTSGQLVTVRQTSSAMGGTPKTVTLTVGGVSGAFTVTTAAPQSGEVLLTSSGTQRSFYLIVPADYDASRAVKPLLFAYHGTSGSYHSWLDGVDYDLVSTVGDQAIIVLAQALPNAEGVNQWNYAYDLQYFQDVFAYIDQRMNFDRGRVFVTGHSSGGGMAHELGCNFGDIIRGIAPISGILRSTECVGAVAVFQAHGEYDTLVPSGTGEAGHKFWALYNGFDPAQSVAAANPVCINHDIAGGSPNPVEWCLHQEGSGLDSHNWPSFASAALWQFFSSLSSESPGSTDPPAGGGNDKVANLIDTTMSFTLQFPAGIHQVTQGAIGLYPAGAHQPLGGGPDQILSLSFDPGAVGPGDEMHYVVPIKWGDQTVFPGTYAIAIVMYVVDGGNPIPAVLKDHIVLFDVDVTDRNTPVVIDTPLLLQRVGSGGG